MEELNELQKTFAEFISNNIDAFFLIMGVYDHFFLLEFTNSKKEGVQISVFDSSNIALTDVMSLKYEQFAKEHSEVDELEF